MKLKCIDNEFYPELKANECYSSELEVNNFYMIVLNKDHVSFVHKSKFEVIE